MNVKNPIKHIQIVILPSPFTNHKYIGKLYRNIMYQNIGILNMLFLKTFIFKAFSLLDKHLKINDIKSNIRLG